MSTKIYDAHRIRKNRVESITGYMRDMQRDVYNFVCYNESLLRNIHTTAYVWAKRQDDPIYKEKLEDGMFIHAIKTFLEESEHSPTPEPWLISMKLACAVAEDNRFWYIKFFLNENWQREIYKEIVEKRTFLKDYHYQNQSDSPEGISQPKYDARNDVWDHILMDRRDYKGVLQYILFDADEFQKMIFRDGDNLAYNFKKEIK